MVNVEIKVENTRKTLRKTLENFEKIHPKNFLIVYKLNICRLFQIFLTNFSTIFSPQSPPNLFHYSTAPTTTTTKYIKEERI